MVAPGSAVGRHALHRRRLAARRHLPAPPPPLPLDEDGTDGDATTDAGVAAAVAWTPAFDAADDLDGLLAAKTPLLARAFRQPTPPQPEP